MARYLGPTCKLSRREGTDLFLKSRKYQPDSYQMSLLTNKNIKTADFGIKKMELAHT